MRRSKGEASDWTTSSRNCTAEASEWGFSQLLDSVLDHLDDGESWEDLRTGVRTTVARAHGSGLLPRATTLEDLDAREERVPDDAVIALRRLAGVAEASRDLWQLMPDPSIGLMALKDYTEFASEVLESIEEDLGGSGGPEPIAGPGEVISATRAVRRDSGLPRPGGFVTTLNERSKSVLGRIINKEQAGLELQAANRMNSFLLNVDRLVGELASLRDCRSYLVGEGLDVGVPTGKRPKMLQRREQIFAQRRRGLRNQISTHRN